MKQSDVLIRPYVTEKSMNHMSGTPTQKYKDGNTIKIVFEERFEVKVEKVWVRIQKDGKHAIIKLADGYSAEDVGSRVGVF